VVVPPRASGCRAWERPSRAAASLRRKRAETVTLRRRSSSVSGWTMSRRARAGWVTGTSGARSAGTGAQGGSASGAAPAAGATGPSGSASAGSARLGAGGRITVTTSHLGGAGHGRMAATTSLASRDEIPRKRGSTSASFSSVRTRDSSPTTDKQSRPSRSAASTLGKRGSSRAAACRYQAAPLERPSSRVRNAKRLACPSRSQPRRRSKSARASRKSAAASCSRRSSRARSSRRARASASVSGGTRSVKPWASQALTGSPARSGSL
jgi:hypothetical protein